MLIILKHLPSGAIPTLLVMAIPWVIGVTAIGWVIFCKFMYWMLGYVWYEWTLEMRYECSKFLFREVLCRNRIIVLWYTEQ